MKRRRRRGLAALASITFGDPWDKVSMFPCEIPRRLLPTPARGLTERQYVPRRPAAERESMATRMGPVAGIAVQILPRYQQATVDVELSALDDSRASGDTHSQSSERFLRKGRPRVPVVHDTLQV